MRNRQPIPLQVGHLHEELTCLAERIQRRITSGDHLVWADDDARVFVARDGEAIDVPTHWIAGRFSMGHPADDIEEDLRSLLRERARDWIVS